MLTHKVSEKAVSASFSGDLANILFNTPADPDRDRQEAEVVSRFEQWVASADRKSIWRMASLIDAEMIPALSGKNLLHVARLLEERAPTVIDSMNNLKKMKAHLQRASDLAEILSPSALDKLIDALKTSSASDAGQVSGLSQASSGD